MWYMCHQGVTPGYQNGQVICGAIQKNRTVQRWVSDAVNRVNRNSVKHGAHFIKC